MRSPCCLCPRPLIFLESDTGLFLAYFLYFVRIKEGLWDHLAVCFSVSPPILSFSIRSVSYQRKVGN
jgi:hypothetical protein